MDESFDRLGERDQPAQQEHERSTGNSPQNVLQSHGDQDRAYDVTGPEGRAYDPSIARPASVELSSPSEQDRQRLSGTTTASSVEEAAADR
jgi:hypothetical protein